ncbi:hypothetical protein CMV_003431 [Castanea mollissima]|uniref:Uncharacterized protein n=1 Tax=Castanea mollissima TaxID=60419 RepID=A0A8J4S0C5_9ROSI|nr:hypothetical protein CMV_003431 [Castanea mollissima]
MLLRSLCFKNQRTEYSTTIAKKSVLVHSTRHGSTLTLTTTHPLYCKSTHFDFHSPPPSSFLSLSLSRFNSTAASGKVEAG